MVFLGLLNDVGERGGGAKRSLLSKICHTHSAMVKLGTVISYLNNIQKSYQPRDTLLAFCWHQHFFNGPSENFVISKKYWYRLHFNTKFLLTLFESLRVVLINIVAILMMPVKLAALGFLKIMVFWNKGSDVIVSMVTKKVLSRDSNYIKLYCRFGHVIKVC